MNIYISIQTDGTNTHQSTRHDTKVPRYSQSHIDILQSQDQKKILCNLYHYHATLLETNYN